MNKRCYLRGTSLLGLFNTVIGCVFNRVLVKVVDVKTNRTMKYYFAHADMFPKDGWG
jgi:hypothetical protein